MRMYASPRSGELGHSWSADGRAVEQSRAVRAGKSQRLQRGDDRRSRGVYMPESATTSPSRLPVLVLVLERTGDVSGDVRGGGGTVCGIFESRYVLDMPCVRT